MILRAEVRTLGMIPGVESLAGVQTAASTYECERR